MLAAKLDVRQARCSCEGGLGGWAQAPKALSSAGVVGLLVSAACA